ncbi:SDR family NAD(P)-dependent oxidoreductase [Agrobacterium tumefaciens]|uniref:SDR family NAD(P)-dependent oxidoreductase n=1 Tax=Agrobacterium TaxID=357 RepID=UPI00157223CF|nr:MULTISPECIES: SDR family NAD(P)-dependent oxidoreductase [unclassified Agrobacterium]MBO9111999.1 SDR family NAD(P)-dependent oxidoreductase [Agrobacterium sp. S2/73]NTA61951.1 SDR family NAD(P)-dependent oxidoreductase [Agrobacterium tumefaciens]QXZ76355.1 SDR family NAD(P)-dependent oxidoreductase [Agrobacterium sp. S7/73]
MPQRTKVLITGATDGIGQLAAIELARRGADLILTARSQSKANATRALIEAAAPGAAVDVFYADFSDLRTVVAVGRAIADRHPRIDVLINNAGLHAFKQRITKDGFAEMMAVNYFAPWLLSSVLRDTLVRSAPARIVTVASEASRRSGALNIEKDLLDTAPFTTRGSSKIYGRTKLLDIMLSIELARQLDGTGVTVNCLDPGFNVTSLGRELGFSGSLAWVLNWLGIGNPARGAGIIARLATDPEFGVKTGLYVSVKNAGSLTPIAPANSEEQRTRLWITTAQLLGSFLMAEAEAGL